MAVYICAFYGFKILFPIL